MEYSDWELVRGVQAWDGDALELLVRRWYPRIYGYVYKLLGDEDDAYDVTQDVFVAMLQHLPGFSPWKRFESWLFTIARNKCMDHFRLRRRVIPAEDCGLDQADPGPPLDDAVPLSLAVKSALGKLSQVQREAAVMHYIYQYTAREIAHMTHTPLSTVKSRLAAAKRIMRRQLEEEKP